MATIAAGDCAGQGECVPYPRYGESVESVIGQIEAVASSIGSDLERGSLYELLPPGAARNALDCALWDLAAKQCGERVWDTLGMRVPSKIVCAYTLSLSDPESMRSAAERHADYPLLKMKVGSDGVMERIHAVRRGAPEAELIVDANEAWTMDMLRRLMPELAGARVSLLEQPLPAVRDRELAEREWLVPIAADESCHTSADVEGLKDRYQVVNIKLDKTGGLTEALELKKKAVEAGLEIMVGCMVGTSLAMAPAALIATGVRFVDLDGPLLLAEDRKAGMAYHKGWLSMPGPDLWG